MEKVKAEIKHIFAHDAPSGLEHWSPDDASNFGLRLQVFIGATDDDKFDSFDATDCSPEWLAENWEAGWFAESRLTDGVLGGHGVLLLRQWDCSELLAALTKLVDQVEGKTWGDVANRIGRHLEWEYGYRYDEHQDEGRPFP